MASFRLRERRRRRLRGEVSSRRASRSNTLAFHFDTGVPRNEIAPREPGGLLAEAFPQRVVADEELELLREFDDVAVLHEEPRLAVADDLGSARYVEGDDRHAAEDRLARRERHVRELVRRGEDVARLEEINDVPVRYDPREEDVAPEPERRGLPFEPRPLRAVAADDERRLRAKRRVHHRDRPEKELYPLRFDEAREGDDEYPVLGKPHRRARLVPVDGEIGPFGVHAVREERDLLARDPEARERHLAARPVVEHDVVIDGAPDRDHLLDALPEVLDSREIEPVEVHHAEQFHDGRNAELPADRFEREERIVRESHEHVGLDLFREPFEPAEHDEGEEGRPDEPSHDGRKAPESS